MKKVLIVDDEEDMVWSLQKTLGGGGLDIDVLTARSGEEALEVLKEIPVDLIVTDIRMPGISGLDLLVEVRKNYPDTAVIVMTAYPHPQFRKEAAEKGSIRFVEKPFDINYLRDVVSEALNGRQDGFRGTVAGIELTDIIQITCLSRTTSALRVRTSEREGIIFFDSGNIVHALCDGLEGEDAFYEILSFRGGTIESIKGAESPAVTIERNWESLLMEGLRRIDEAGRDAAAGEVPVPETATKEETMEDIKATLKEFTDIDGVTAACLVGRDGFVLDSVAPEGMDTEMVGAIASTGLGSSESMGKQLGKGGLNMCMVEYEGGSIFLAPVSQEAFLVVVAEDRANLGMIRFATKKHRDVLSLSTVM